jgi:hypothetical protein
MGFLGVTVYRLAARGAGVKALSRGREAVAGPDGVCDNQADNERESGNHLKVKQRLGADATNSLEIAHRCDPMHNRAKDDRRDHHLDQFHKAIAQRLQSSAKMWKDVTNQRP